MIKKMSSSPVTVCCGVPQGFILGTLLFYTVHFSTGSTLHLKSFEEHVPSLNGTCIQLSLHGSKYIRALSIDLLKINLYGGLESILHTFITT